MARILVVEDNAPNRKLMLYLLRAFGYTALEARHGAEALTMIRAERPDLVVCDLQMPMMDGFALVAEVRRDPVLAELPMVAVTALALVGDRDRALQAGFDGYIAKPIDPETFVAELRRQLLLSRAGASTDRAAGHQ